MAIAKTIYKKLNMAVEAINATIIEDDAFVMVRAARKGEDLYALAKSGELDRIRIEEILRRYEGV